MTTTATDINGRVPGAKTKRLRFAGLLALFGLLLTGAVQAENVLEDMSYSAQPGGRVEVTLRFSVAVN